MGWYVTKHQGIVADEQTGKTIAVTYDKAHAPIVAASQDLLAALENLLCEPMAERTVDAAKRAIAKAKGAA